MSKEGPGEILVKEPKTAPQLVEVEVHLYNFDTDVSALKVEHKEFLNKNVIPALTGNPDARVRLHGSASKIGAEAYNKDLSRNRATEVYYYLTKLHDVKPAQVIEFKPLGEDFSTSPLNNDPRDRAVFIFLKLPITIEDIFLWTDDWTRELQWDDIIGLGGTDQKWIKNMNIQVKTSGVPRFWNLKGGLSLNLMPAKFLLEAVGTRGGRFSGNMRWPIPKAEARAQPNDLTQTLYRLSGDVNDMGFFRVDNSKTGVATVTRKGGTSSLELGNLGWADRGYAEQEIPRPFVRADALRLLHAGGVEILSLRGWVPKTWQIPWLIRSPATVFYYSGSGNKDGCLAIGSNCWASPKALQDYWKMQSDMKVLIVAAPVLDITFANGLGVGGPGRDWAKLLKSKGLGGPLSAILGYRDEAPAEKHVGEEIAKTMGKRIAAGLNKDQWVQVWLDINGDHDGKNTWNAVAMDDRGYWWIERRDRLRRGWWKGPWYTIEGPAGIH
jgi:hypothetical protein